MPGTINYLLNYSFWGMRLAFSSLDILRETKVRDLEKLGILKGHAIIIVRALAHAYSLTDYDEVLVFCL